MDDALVVRGFKRLTDLTCDRQHIDQRKRSSRDDIRECLAVDQLEDDADDAIRVFESVHGGDVGMVQRGEQLGLALKTGETIGILRERFGQNLDGDLALQPRIRRAIDFAHSACADQAENFVRAEPGARIERHWVVTLSPTRTESTVFPKRDSVYLR